jgi:2-C-methyl-D-erythritol 4-phosphate cytidylyltransferase
LSIEGVNGILELVETGRLPVFHHVIRMTDCCHLHEILWKRVDDVKAGIVVAGGHGSRVGFKKQFVLLAGKPMWMRSVEALLSAGVSAVWLVVPKEDMDKVQQDIDRNHFESHVHVIEGGRERNESVYFGVQALANRLKGVNASEVLVVIHDAARPFVRVADVESTVRVAQECGAAILGKRCVDTMKRVDTNLRIESTVDRNALWHAETPQVFRLDWLQQAYSAVRFHEARTVAFTDEASLLEGLGYTVKMVEATGFNGKVTTKEDVEFSMWWASRRWGEPDDDSSRPRI